MKKYFKHFNTESPKIKQEQLEPINEIDDKTTNLIGQFELDDQLTKTNLINQNFASTNLNQRLSFQDYFQKNQIIKQEQQDNAQIEKLSRLTDQDQKNNKKEKKSAIQLKSLNIINKILEKSEKEEPQKVSSESKNIINNILDKQKKNIEPILYNLEEQKPSLQDKYEDLLTDQILRLPWHFKRLLNHFEFVDQIIYFFNMRKRPTFFIEIQKNIVQTFKQNISIKNIQQIKYLFPESYKVQWLEKDNDFLIHLEKNDELTDKERSRILKNKLIEQVKDHYKQFLIQNHRIDELILDWDSDFDLHNVFHLHQTPDIELWDLPSKPLHYDKNIKSLKEMKEENLIKDQNLEQKVMQILEERKNIDIKSEILPQQKAGQFLIKESLSLRLLEKIKAKEQLLKEEKKTDTIKIKPVQDRQKISTLTKIAENIQYYFNLRNVSHMFFINVIHYLKKNVPSLMLSFSIYLKLDEIKDNIEIIQMNTDNWLTFKNTSDGIILSMDKKITNNLVYSQIKNIQN